MTQVSDISRVDFDDRCYRICDALDDLNVFLKNGTIDIDAWKKIVNANDLIYDLTTAGQEEIPYGN